MAYVPTDLVSTLLELITRFNDPLYGGRDYYDSYSELLDLNVEMKEVDSTLSGGSGAGPSHKRKNYVLSYLKTSQSTKIPQCNEGDHSSWNVADAGTIGIVSGTGTYKDKLTDRDAQPVKYCFVFGKTGGNWLLTVAFASLLP